MRRLLVAALAGLTCLPLALAGDPGAPVRPSADPFQKDTLLRAMMFEVRRARLLVGYGVVIGLATFVVFSASGRIARVLGRTGINVMTRLMGLILAAMAVELLSDGLGALFPVLASGKGGAG